MERPRRAVAINRGQTDRGARGRRIRTVITMTMALRRGSVEPLRIARSCDNR
jgi:hypothetical protein